MIIQYIENRHGFWFFSKDKLAVITDEGEGAAAGNIEEGAARQLNEKLKGYNVASKEDFAEIKKICGENYKIVEECIINSSPKFWAVLNDSASQIPRPMALILKKDSGIRGFYTVSLDCGDFMQACYINQRIFEAVRANLEKENFRADEAGYYHNLDDKKVFEVLSSVVKDISKGVTFNVRIGVNLKADYFGRTRNDQFNYVINLVFNNNILFAMDPMKPDDAEMYAKLKEKIVGDCYIAVSQFERFDDKKADFILLKQNELAELENLQRKAKEKNLNVIFDGEPDICVGFGFPIIKLDLSKDGDKKIGRINQILEEIKAEKELEKKGIGVINN